MEMVYNALDPKDGIFAVFDKIMTLFRYWFYSILEQTGTNLG